MKNKTNSLIIALALFAGTALVNPVSTLAADPPAAAPVGRMESLVVGKVKVNESVTKSAADEGRSNKLDRVSEAVDTQFQASLSGMRKFKVLVGGDLSSILDEFKKDPLLSKENPDARTAGTLIPPKYVVVPRIDDFQDVGRRLTQGNNVTARRDVRVSVVTTIYNINTGEVYEVLNTHDLEFKVGGEIANTDTKGGDLKDELLLIVTKKVAADSAQRVLDVLFPAKVISKVENVVQINRGDGTNIAAGQVWDVVVQGAENKDPDTGEVLSHDEAPSGKVRITRVFPKYSTAEVIESINIEKGNVLHLHEEKEDAPAKAK